MTRFSRTPPRLDRYFDRSPLFFLTFCTFRRRTYLATDAVHDAFILFCERACAEHRILVGRYVIMPDHVHLFVGGPEGFVIGRWLAGLKQAMGKAVVRPPSEDSVWQRGFFDHILRHDESYAEKWDYTRQNPVRAGLSGTADAWPFAGEIFPLDSL